MPIVPKIPKLPSAEGSNPATFGTDNAKWIENLIKVHDTWLTDEKVEVIQKM